jgi:hypothetical protein
MLIVDWVLNVDSFL